jgi:chemotaxis signal transduction protein
VDSVSDVTDVGSEAIREEGGERRLVSKILHFDGGQRLVLLFDLEQLIPRREAA